MATTKSTDARLASVRDTAAALNAISDQAAESVRKLEEFLSVDCGAGVFASIVLSADDDGAGGEYVTELCYGRLGPRFRIYWRGYHSYDPPETSSEKAWAELSRDKKIETLPRLPELVEAVDNGLNKQLQQAKAALEFVQEFTVPKSAGDKKNAK